MEIAELCGITPAAVSLLTRDLLQRGLIAEGARRKSVRGAPHIDLGLEQSVGYSLGVHASHFAVMLTLLDFRGNLVQEMRLPGTYDKFPNVVKAIRTGTEALLSARSIDRETLIGTGVALPTRFRNEAVSLDLAEEVISWAGTDLAIMLREALDCPVMIENDANAAAMGELTLGNSAGHDNFAYMYLSEGIGGGLIIRQELYRGNLGNAGEIGALRSRGLSRPSFEDLAQWCSDRIGEIPQGRAPDVWTEYLERNSPVLDSWLERAGPEVARLAFAISAVMAPSAIYVGGTLPRIVRERLAEWLDYGKSTPFASARVVQPQILLPDVISADSVAFGAAAMILHNVSELH
jgi:predicted NBD/HSP70 family sugar kinase